MKLYCNCLLILKELFRQSGNSHWQNWIEQDIIEWDTSKSTVHHRRAFGGMGSINDQIVGGQNKNGYWQNTLFELIKNISWTLALEHTIDIEQHLEKGKAPQIEGWICRNCTYGEVTALDIENYLSTIYLPKLVIETLDTENFWDLTEIESLTQLPLIVEQRKVISDAIEDNHITLISSNNRNMRPCPICKSMDTCVYRWDIYVKEKTVEVSRGSNNLKLKKSSISTATSWWKRLMGYS